MAVQMDYQPHPLTKRRGNTKSVARRLRELANELETEAGGGCRKKPTNITMACRFEPKRCLTYGESDERAYLTIWHQGQQIGAQRIEIGDWDMEEGYKLTPQSATFKIEKLC